MLVMRRACIMRHGFLRLSHRKRGGAGLGLPIHGEPAQVLGRVPAPVLAIRHFDRLIVRMVFESLNTLDG